MLWSIARHAVPAVYQKDVTIARTIADVGLSVDDEIQLRSESVRPSIGLDEAELRE